MVCNLVKRNPFFFPCLKMLISSVDVSECMHSYVFLFVIQVKTEIIMTTIFMAAKCYMTWFLCLSKFHVLSQVCFYVRQHCYENNDIWSLLELTSYLCHSFVCDFRENNPMKISHCFTRTGQTHKLSFECCLSFSALVDLGRCKRFEGCVFLFTPPGLLQGTSRNSPIALNLDFCFPQ
jgi:hypothetical protein